MYPGERTDTLGGRLAGHGCEGKLTERQQQLFEEVAREFGRDNADVPVGKCLKLEGSAVDGL